MELKGKKIAFLGDSITEGVGTSSLENVYWRVVEKLTGATCIGYGISGTRIAPQHKKAPDGLFEEYFASRVDEMEKDVDTVVVFGGTNDYGHGDAPFGKLTDREESTFCGAFHVLLKKLLNKYPDAEIIVMTPLHRLNESDTTYNGWGARREHTLQDYVDAICSISAYYGLPVLDLYRTSGIQPEIPVIQEHYMPDGLHPNDAGNQKIAQRFIGFMQTI